MKLLLCLDGGGIRGVYTARFLMNLDDELVKTTGKGIREHFNLFSLIVGILPKISLDLS